LGKGAEALVDFDVLIELEPYNTDFMSDRGVVLHLLGRNEDALTELDRAANLDPKNPYRYSSRAYLKDRIGDFMGAIEDYEKAIELDPEDAVAFNNLGLVEEKLGRKEKAKDYFEKADSLSGYPPKKEDEVTPSVTPNQTEKLKPTRPISQVSIPKLTPGHILEVVHGIFTKPAIRKEFSTYLKGLFATKKG
jgi:tetratricopeptide (TPR) repeat protein